MEAMMQRLKLFTVLFCTTKLTLFTSFNFELSNKSSAFNVIVNFFLSNCFCTIILNDE